MDFLVLLTVYLAIFICGSLALLYRDAAVFCTGPLGAVRGLIIQTVNGIVPSSVQHVLIRLGNKLLYERTCFFQGIFIVLCLLAHAVWLVDMIPILVKHYPDQNHTFWPFVAVFTNYYFLHKAWITDPGEITKSNVDKYMSVYKYDDILYQKDVSCSTCQIVKPARSKHCSVCNRCVQRFDHHCIWTNNCVGTFTHRYFILFMVSLIAMFLQGIYVGTWCLLDFADDVQLFSASYIEEDGSIHPITFSVAFQHLFMKLPRLVFLVVGLSVLTILVLRSLVEKDRENIEAKDENADNQHYLLLPQCLCAHLFMQLPRLVFLVVGLSVLTILVLVFLFQHLYFIVTNQTTNETYKVKNIDWETVQQNAARDKQGNRTVKQPGKISRYQPYDQGVLNNIIEVFFPKYFIHQKLKKS